MFVFVIVFALVNVIVFVNVVVYVLVIFSNTITDESSHYFALPSLWRLCSSV